MVGAATDGSRLAAGSDVGQPLFHVKQDPADWTSSNGSGAIHGPGNLRGTLRLAVRPRPGRSTGARGGLGYTSPGTDRRLPESTAPATAAGRRNHEGPTG